MGEIEGLHEIWAVDSCEIAAYVEIKGIDKFRVLAL